MKIIELRAEQFKRLTAVTIRPTGNVVEVSGENGSGKSSTLDSIWAALGGKDASPAKPIHTGAEKGEIRLTIGESGVPKIIVTRKYRLKEGVPFTTDLIVESAEGARFQGAQGVLDALVGETCFDPVGFIDGMDDKAQIKALRSFVPEVDFDAIEGMNRRDFEIRTDLNREAKSLKAQVDALPAAPEELPERVDTGALEARLAEAAHHNSDIATRQTRRQALDHDVQQIELEISGLEERKAALLATKAKWEPLPEPIDVADVQQQLSFGRMSNSAADMADRRSSMEKALGEKEAAAEALTKAIDKRKADAAKAVQTAKMPIPGLGFGDGFVTLNGEPLAQASRAQQIRASVAIAAAMNPKLRVAMVKEGSLLDKKSWAALEEYAAEHDMQIWVESVHQQTKAAILIQDGALAETPAAPAADPGDVV